jgi:fucose permease
MDKAVTLLCAFTMGMCFSLLGAVSVKLMPRLRIDQGQFGTLVSAVMAACLVTSLVAGVVLDTVGYRPVALFGFVVSGVCVLLLAHVRTYAATLGSCFLLGVGAMSLSMAAMTLMPVVLFGGKNPAAANNLGNVAFGVGLLLTPLLVSFLFRRISYELALSVVAVIVVAPVIPALLLTTYPQSQAAAFSLGDAVALLREPAVLVAGCALFCYTSLEQSFTSWLPAFGKEMIGARSNDGGAADAAAQRLLSLFAVAMMLGRLAASQVPAITEYGSWMMAGAAMLAALVVVLMIVTRQPWQAALLAVLAGLVLAPCFPTTVGITFAKYRPAVYGSVFGIIFAMAMLGGAIVPKLIGNLAKGSSVQRSLRLLLPACVVFAVLVIVLGQIRTTL